MMRWIRLAILGFTVFASADVALSEPNFGKFVGELVLKMTGDKDDGRTAILQAPFSYIDPDGEEWSVPAGSITDGATIPRYFWITHPPFTGQYRSAAVIHDYYCDRKSRTWEATHYAFYRAMRASGVSEVLAKTMYGAVYYFGPRWGEGAAASRWNAGKTQATEAEQAAFVERLESWIETENPDIAAIGHKIDVKGENVGP